MRIWSRVARVAAVAVAFGLVGSAQNAGRSSQPDQQRDQGQDQQQTQPPPAGNQPPVFRSGINFVRVDVIVSDKSGANIADLKQTDFEVTEDGKPQSIESFKLIKLDGGASPSPDGPPRAIRTDFDEEQEAARDDVRLFGIFLDDYHVRRLASMSVRNPLTQFIGTQLGPSDMVGLMYPLQPISSVRMTRNHDAIIKAIGQFEGRKFDYTPKNPIEEQYVHYPTETVERIRNQVSLSALKGLIIHMGSLKEGRKALILVSEGYSYMLPPQMRNANAMMPGLGNPDAFNPLAGTSQDPTASPQRSINEDRANFAATMDMEQDLRNVYDEANRQNVSIYAVDPRGLATNEFDVSDPSIAQETDRKFLNATIDTLRNLSDSSDGRAIVNRNDLVGGMRQIIRDSSGYYLLGYNSSVGKPDGKFHEIKVKVKRSGLQVRARKGYWAYTTEDVAKAMAPPKPDAPKDLQAALNNASSNVRSRVVRTWVGTARGENGKTKVTLVWEPVPKQPGDRTQPEEQPARVAVMAVGTDGAPYFRGRVPDVALASTSLSTASLNSESASRTPTRVTFDARPGKMQLRLSIEGQNSQVLDSETREIDVPDLTTTQAAFGTPLVFRARTARDMQQLKADPQALPTVNREFSRTDRLLVRVPAYGAGKPAVSCHMLNRTGQSMFELPVTDSPAAAEQHVIEVPLAGLAPGEYVLELKVAAEGSEAKELIGFRVTT